MRSGYLAKPKNSGLLTASSALAILELFANPGAFTLKNHFFILVGFI